MERYDVIIVSAGMAGSAAAWRLAATHQVLVLEQFGFLHSLGSSHGSSRIFRHAYGDSSYVDLAIAAGEGWRELEHDSGESLLYRTGGLDLATRRIGELDKIASALDEVGQVHEMLDAAYLPVAEPCSRLTQVSSPQAAAWAPCCGWRLVGVRSFTGSSRSGVRQQVVTRMGGSAREGRKKRP